MEKISRCIRLAAADAGLTVPSRESAADIIGLGLVEATNQLFPGLDPADANAFTKLYSRHFREQDKAPCQFFPGVTETLDILKGQGYILAVATGKSRAGLDRVLAARDMSDYFDGSRCADETLSKPNPLMLNELLDQFSVSSNEALMVGDTEFDLSMAEQASMRSIGVNYGAHSKERLKFYHPIACVDRFSDILKYL